jgi:hypothetical protein
MPAGIARCSASNDDLEKRRAEVAGNRIKSA